MEQSKLSDLEKRKWLVRGAIAAGVGLALLIIFMTVINLAPRTAYEVTPLNLSNTSTHTQLKNDKLYSYNGSAFTVSDITKNEPPTVLHPGLKLPIPSQIEWANENGALIQFQAGFTYTEVERYLEDNNISLFSDYSSYVWYLDFKEGSLHLASTDPLLGSELHYSESANGFYLTIDNSTDKPSNLAFYSIEDKKLDYIESVPPLSIVSHIGDCFDAKSICITATDFMENAEPTIFRLDTSSHESSKLVSSDGIILPTSSPDVYVVYSQLDEDSVDDSRSTSTASGSENNSHEVDVDHSLAPGRLYNIKTSQYSDMGVDIQDASISTLINTSGNDIAYLSLGQGVEYTSRTKTIIGTYTNSVRSLSGDVHKDSSSMLIPLHYSGSNQILATDTNANLYIVAPEGHVSFNLEPVNTKDLQATIESCRAAGVNDFEIHADTNEVDIFTTANNDFLKKVRDIARCISEDSKNQTGYIFTYKGTDPETGRLVVS